MSKLFLSHSSKDDNLVRALQQTLANMSQEVWIDSRELKGGDLLWPDIQRAIEQADAYAVLVSPDGLQSKWVGKELRHALSVQTQRGRDNYPVIPFSLNQTQLGVLEEFFDDESLYIPINSEAGGLDKAINAILVALGKRLPSDPQPTPQPKAEPLEELVLELTDLKLHDSDNSRRASAKARLVYEPATPGQEKTYSLKRWSFIAPIGPIESDEIRWYLEKFPQWPGDHFQPRAKKVEQDLIEWGKQLYEAAMPLAKTNNVLQAWAKIASHANRRFSVYLDTTPDDDLEPAAAETAREAATLLLGLPWELLHDGNNFLFQGAKPTRVRRRLPSTQVLDVPVVAPPIRILLITARPEDASCDYINHRASALPLVDAMEQLGGLVELRLLNPPTLPSLSAELDRARDQRQPYHVVHFDGHGVFDRQCGLGGLCFEHPQDSDKLDQRRHQTIYTNQLGPLLNQHRIPLVFLEACQTAQAEQASESVASELLKVGVASVVAMSHSVLVKTASVFVAAFYASLADGGRVGDAMLAGQRKLKDDSFRGHVFGKGELHLHDWFVSVLFQEKADPQLFRAIPSLQTQADVKTALNNRMGALPPAPDTGFIGRSRDLLALERLLCGASNGPRYAVIRGQGGEGKTALAVEFARWLVRSQQIQRVAFVSVETNGNAAAVRFALCQQLHINDSATLTDANKALQALERALTEQATLLVIDNMESVLLPPYLAATTPDALNEDAARELQAILDLCHKLNAIGDTRLLCTSRQALPAPFANTQHLRELKHLALNDAVELVEKVLGGVETGAAARRSQLEDIEDLVKAVNCHARSLALLAEPIRQRGITATRVALVDLLADMDKRFPGNREQSLYASVALSLRRLSPDNQQRVQALAVFHGSVDLNVLMWMTEWEQEDVSDLALELINTGLATANPSFHINLDPALCPYLREQLTTVDMGNLGQAPVLPQTFAELQTRWAAEMRDYVNFLVEQANQKPEIAATLTLLELSNLFALLEYSQQADDAAATIDLATALYRLLQNLGKPRLLAKVGQVRDAAAKHLGASWNHAQFQAQRTRIEQLLADGQSSAALNAATALLQQARTAGAQAYDSAMACWLLALVLMKTSNSAPALPLLKEARKGFTKIAAAQGDKAAARMAAKCLAVQGDCLRQLGRFDEAAKAYEESIRLAEQLEDERQVAVGKGQLGTVYFFQRRYLHALDVHEQARDQFAKLQELGMVATAWHQIGRTHQAAGQPEAAEAAYQEAYRLEVQLGDAVRLASTLGQLGILYSDVLNRSEEATRFFKQAADIFNQFGDKEKEGRVMNNLADTLRKLRCYDPARAAIQHAITCNAEFGYAAEPWIAWHILANIETDCGNLVAASTAKQKAIAAYLAYRRDGGENHTNAGRIAHAVRQTLSSDGTTAVIALLEAFLVDSKWQAFHTYLNALIAVLNGFHDPSLAAADDLNYSMAAEILLLLETVQ